MRIPRFPFRASVCPLDAACAELISLQKAGLKPHVGDLDCFLIGSSSFPGGIDLLEIAMNRKPNIGLADRRVGRLHVADFDDERCRYRVAQEFIEGTIVTGDFLERGALIVGSLAID